MLRVGVKWSGVDLPLFAQNVFDQQPQISVANNAGVESPCLMSLPCDRVPSGVTALYHY